MRTLSLVICLCLTTLFANLPVANSTRFTSVRSAPPSTGVSHADPEIYLPQASQADPEPLPRGCGSVTPPGEELAACCLSGFVFIDGQAVAGAEVTITSARGDRVVFYTQEYSDLPGKPSYRLSLSEAPLNIQAGETITIEARYSSHERSLSYAVQPNSQQVDVVLARNQADDYVVGQMIWGQGAPGKFNNPQGIAVDGQGHVFVTDYLDQRIQVLTREGVFVRQWGTIGNLPKQFTQPHGIAIDGSGNVYIADSGNNRIQKFDNQGNLLAVWGSWGSEIGQLNKPSGLALDADANLYVADTLNDRIQKFSPTGAPITSWGSLGSANGMFNRPEELAINQQTGIVYVADRDNHRIQQFTLDGQFVRSWGNQGNNNSQFNQPSSVAIHPDGSVYILDTSNHRVQQFSADGLWLATWGERGNADHQLNYPGSIAIDTDGSVYITDNWSDSIKKFNSTGQWLAVWRIDEPTDGQVYYWLGGGLEIDSNGDILTAEVAEGRIQRIRNNGQVVASWSDYGPVHSIVRDNANDFYILGSIVFKLASDGSQILRWGSIGSEIGQFSNARDLALDSAGNVYVADNHRIQKFSPTGQWLAAWGSYGSGVNQFNNPWGVAVDTQGNIYVADQGNDRIVKLNSSGEWIKTWGAPGIGPGLFQVIERVRIDTQGHVFVIDTSGDMVQKFDSDGNWLSSWGSIPFRVGSTPFEASGNVPGELDSPRALALSATGNVYVGEGHNGRIQIFRPMTYTRPIATITHVELASLEPEDTLRIRGMGQDSDETPGIAAYRWTSSQDGVIGTTPTITRAANSLRPGSHRITLEVQDTEGEWSTPVSTSIFVATPPEVTWTALLYLAGDYTDRGSQFTAFNRALDELQTSLRNPAIRVVAQVDGPADGDTYRMLIVPGNPPQITRFDQLGEQAMDDPATLSDFIRWGQSSFPATQYYLAIANHGQALQGIAWDRTSDLKDDGVNNQSAYMTSAELGQALRADGVAPIHVLHLDACSMNLIEVAYELRPQADVPMQSRLLIASQYLGWNFFAFDTYINAIGRHDTPASVALQVTASYATRGIEAKVPYTIAALDLGRVEPLATAIDNLAAELAAHINNDRARLDVVEQIWKASPRFESNGDYLNNDLDDYVDLLTWTNKIQLGISNPAVQERAFALIRELTGTRPFILAGSNRVGNGTLPIRYANGAFIDLSGASGLSIFYPGSNDSVAFERYIDDRLFAFTSATRWADFLVSGLGIQPPGLLRPLPGPSLNLDLDTPYQVFIPLVQR